MNPDSMSEYDLTKSFTHDRPEPSTQPPTERPASIVLNDCHICGLPVRAPQQFHPTKQDCINALRSALRNQIERKLWAAEDDEVTFGTFFHMERMDDDFIWFRIDGATFELTARSSFFGRPKIIWHCNNRNGWADIDPAADKPA
jgi:hypothetical protein